MSETNLVQFRVSFLEPGYLSYVNDNEEILPEESFIYGLNGKSLTDVFEKIAPSKEGGLIVFSHECWRLKEPIVEIGIVGQIGENPYQSGLEHEVEMMSKEEVFGDYLEEIVKLALPEKEKLEKARLKPDYPNRHEDPFDKTVSITTLWNWSSYWTNTMDGVEFETDWELIGSINMKCLDSVVKLAVG